MYKNYVVARGRLRDHGDLGVGKGVEICFVEDSNPGEGRVITMTAARTLARGQLGFWGRLFRASLERK